MTFEDSGKPKNVDVYCVTFVARECKTDRDDIVTLVALPPQLAKEVSALCVQIAKTEAGVSNDIDVQMRKKHPKGQPKGLAERSRYDREHNELNYKLQSERLFPLDGKLRGMVQGMPQETIYPPTGRLNRGDVLTRNEAFSYPKIPPHPFCGIKQK